MQAEQPPKFHYYVTDLSNGDVRGTNKENTAWSYAASDEHFVVDAVEGKLLYKYKGEQRFGFVIDLDDDSKNEGF